MTIRNAIAREVHEARYVVQALRSDAVLLIGQHPTQVALHARLLQAAAMIERLAKLLLRQIA